MLGYDDLAFDLNFQSSIDYKKEEFTISLDTLIYDAFGLKTKLSGNTDDEKVLGM